LWPWAPDGRATALQTRRVRPARTKTFTNMCSPG
jgi:hypothetical protein